MPRVSHDRGALRVHTLIDSLTWGGAESLLADLAAAAPAAGLALSVGYLQDIDGSPSARRLRAAGVEPQLLGTGRLTDPRSLAAVRAHLARVAPDVVHTHLDSADVLGGLAARSLGLPSVCTVHLAATAVSADPGARGRAKAALVERVRRHTARTVIAVSDAARAAYLARAGGPPARVVTVHNGIAHASPARPAAAIRAELGLAAEAVVVAMVSVLRPGKGHEVAIAALAALADRHPDAVLLLVGDGPSREEIRALAAPLGDRVVLAGHRDDVGAVLAAADALVHPTRMDAFPTVLLEAAAAGLPVVATRVGGVPEIVVDGTTGVLVPAPPEAGAFAAALAPLLGDAPLRARLGAAAGARFAAEFAADRWAVRLRAVYESAGAGRRA
jgi:glycosyltransferase involved in cell wall biosynthesis